MTSNGKRADEASGNFNDLAFIKIINYFVASHGGAWVRLPLRCFYPPPTRCSTKGQPTRLLGNDSAEISLQTNATYHAELQVYRVNSTLQLHRVDEPLLLRCTVQNFLGTNSQDITLVPHGEHGGRWSSWRWGEGFFSPGGAGSQHRPLTALRGRKPTPKLEVSAQNEAFFELSRKGCPRRSL